jgi:hypothetical protein
MLTVTERISSIVTEKMKGRTARKGKESRERPLMMNSVSITTMDEEHTQHNHQRGRRVRRMI